MLTAARLRAGRKFGHKFWGFKRITETLTEPVLLTRDESAVV